MKRLPKLTFPVRLDMGCGKNKIDQHIGMDSLDFGQEIVWNINDGIPLPNDSVIAFHSSHFFEHLKKEELPNAFNEIVRVCMKDTPVTIIVPHADTHQAHYLCHYSYWHEAMIKGVCEDHFNLELVSTSRNGIHFTMNLKVKKG